MEQFILFTMNGCSHCTNLKKDNLMRNALQSYVQEVNMNNANPQMVKLFRMVSSGGNLPAMAVLEQGQLVDGAVGTDAILDLISTVE